MPGKKVYCWHKFECHGCSGTGCRVMSYGPGEPYYCIKIHSKDGKIMKWIPVKKWTNKCREDFYDSNGNFIWNEEY